MDNVLDSRSARYMATELPRIEFPMFRDQRSSHGLKRTHEEFFRGMVTAMVAGRLGFRGMEKLTGKISPAMRPVLGIPKRIPDTSARDFVLNAEHPGVRDGLKRYVKGLYHRGVLDELGEHMPIKMVSLDGKYDRARVRVNRKDGVLRNRSVIRQSYPYFQADEEAQSGWLWGEVRTLSVVLASSPSTPCLDCVPVAGCTNEMGTFDEAFGTLLNDWGWTRLFEAVCVDAGMVSLDNATLVKQAGVDYIMAIKGGQPELQGKLNELLDPRTTPDAQSTERYKGKNLTYRLWRTKDAAGWLDWSHLKQGLLIRRTLCADDSSEPDQDEYRFYASSIPWSRLCHEEWLVVVRAHWRIENNLHWTLDKILREGKRPWIRDPHGMLVMNILRRIAYNVLARQRARTLCSDDTMIPWADLIEMLYDALRLARLEDIVSRRHRRWLKKNAA